MNIQTVEEKLAEATRLFSEARAIYSKADATAEEKASAAQMFEAAKAIKQESAQLAEIEKAAADMVATIEAKQGKDKQVEPRKDNTKFGSFGEFLYAAHRANHKDAGYRHVDPRLQWFRDEKEPGQSKTMTENVGAAGGFLVPGEFMAELQGVMAENALVRPRATIIRMRHRDISIPVVLQTGTTAGVPHWFGGMKFYWGEEAAEKTNSDPAFGKVTLSAKKLYGYTYASDELVDDAAISLSDFLGGPMGMSGGLAWTEDYSFINGTGAGQPLGVINAPATITVARAGTTTPVTYPDLVNMVESFLPSGRGVWFISQSAISNLMTLVDGASAYIWGSTEKGVPNTLLGYPVVFTEKCPRVGSAGDVILADWRYYLIGDRQATTLESTQYDRWKYDETSWRAVHRVDGQPWLSDALRYQDGTTEVSPFVILGAKST
jgi:HK97 family phage major capsid protein